MEHAKVTINPTTEELSKFSGLSFTLICNSKDFVRRYSLIDSSSERARKIGRFKLRIKIQGKQFHQQEFYVSNNPELIDAVKEGDWGNLKFY